MHRLFQESGGRSHNARMVSDRGMGEKGALKGCRIKIPLWLGTRGSFSRNVPQDFSFLMELFTRNPLPCPTFSPRLKILWNFLLEALCCAQHSSLLNAEAAIIPDLRGIIPLKGGRICVNPSEFNAIPGTRPLRWFDQGGAS